MTSAVQLPGRPKRAARSAKRREFRRRDSNPDKRNQNPVDLPSSESDPNDPAPIDDADEGARGAIVDVPPRSAAASDPLAGALARALDAAVAAGDMALVRSIVAELAARRGA